MKYSQKKGKKKRYFYIQRKFYLIMVSEIDIIKKNIVNRSSLKLNLEKMENIYNFKANDK